MRCIALLRGLKFSPARCLGTLLLVGGIGLATSSVGAQSLRPGASRASQGRIDAPLRERVRHHFHVRPDTSARLHRVEAEIHIRPGRAGAELDGINSVGAGLYERARVAMTTRRARQAEQNNFTRHLRGWLVLLRRTTAGSTDVAREMLELGVLSELQRARRQPSGRNRALLRRVEQHLSERLVRDLDVTSQADVPVTLEDLFDVIADLRIAGYLREGDSTVRATEHRVIEGLRFRAERLALYGDQTTAGVLSGIVREYERSQSRVAEAARFRARRLARNAAE